MAKGKFKKQMHEKGMDLQKLRSELNAKPTSNGYAVAESYNHNSNYIDSFIDDLMDESKQMTKRGGNISLLVKEGFALVRVAKNHDEIDYSFYFNHEEMFEYSDRFNAILRDRTLYFVPDSNGLKVDFNGSFPKLRTWSLRKQIAPLVEINKNYPIHKIVSRDNRKIWFIEL